METYGSRTDRLGLLLDQFDQVREMADDWSVSVERVEQILAHTGTPEPDEVPVVFEMVTEHPLRLGLGEEQEEGVRGVGDPQVEQRQPHLSVPGVHPQPYSRVAEVDELVTDPEGCQLPACAAGSREPVTRTPGPDAGR